MASGEKQYLIGRRDQSDHGLLWIGKYLALDRSSGAPVMMDVLRPHAVLICGKRGYGKSYTMGVIIEEIARLPGSLRNNFSAIVIDTMGIYSCMGRSCDDLRQMNEWGIAPGGINIKVHAPTTHVEDGSGIQKFEIPSSSLSAYDYCELLGIDPVSESGSVLIGAISDLKSFTIDELASRISTLDVRNEVKETLHGLLSMVSGWRLFSKGATFDSLLEPGSVNIIDLSGYGHDPEIRSAIVASLARALYDLRVRARRREADRREVPLIWMFIDEAHMFLDSSKESRAGAVLINEWLRQGRQPGLSLVLATQRPSALGKDVLSQADIVICHRLTYKDDIDAMESVRPSYVKEPVRDAMQRLGSIRGAALIVDDTTESYHVVRIRPRGSEHGGGEPVVFDAD